MLNSALTLKTAKTSTKKVYNRTMSSEEEEKMNMNKLRPFFYLNLKNVNIQDLIINQERCK